MKKLLLLGLAMNAVAMISPCFMKMDAPKSETDVSVVVAESDLAPQIQVATVESETITDTNTQIDPKDNISHSEDTTDGGISGQFILLLLCIFVLGVGTTFLQVAGNPIMRDVSAEGKFSANLAFAQGFKGIGSTVSTYLATAGVASVVIVKNIEWFQNLGWRWMFPIFFILMAVAFVLVSMLKIEESTPDTPPSIASSLSLLKKPVFAFAVLGIFLYVGAEVCMTTFTKPMLEHIGIEPAKATWLAATLFLLMLTVGRLSGGAIARVICPRMFFRVSALLGVIGGVMLMLGNPSLAVVGVVLAGLGFANIWPMLFSITVEEDPSRGGELSGLMCMAISGGAIVPLVMSKMVDMDMGTKSFAVPVICFVYLLIISLKGESKKAAA